jgi:hypothetical protein
VDWDSYKRLCDAPDTFSRWMLEQTALLLEAQGQPAASLLEALAGEPLAKPEGHRGPAATDMFQLAMTPPEVRRVCGLVARAIAQGLTTPATRARGLGGFEAAWVEYVALLDAAGERTAAER